MSWMHTPNWNSETKLMPPMACHFHKDTGDAWQPRRNFSFFKPQAHFGSWATCLCLKFRHCVHIASIYIVISDRRLCQQSKTVFSSARCLCTGSLLSVSLLHSLASWLLQRTVLGSWLWRRFSSGSLDLPTIVVIFVLLLLTCFCMYVR